MINEFELFHGVVFARMLHATQRQLSIRPYSASDNAAYVMDNSKGIYIKYSSKRLSPWRFSFQKRHQETILEMKRSLGEVFLLFVCNHDGVIVLTFAELKQILDEHHEAAEWISATRESQADVLDKRN